jgi:hypothetical protein
MHSRFSQWRRKRLRRALASVATVLLLCSHSWAAESGLLLDRGFHLLYNLDFTAAQEQFARYERERPEDPLGPTSQAAGLLFAELDRLGILESAFAKETFHPEAKLAPDPRVYERFDSALQRADAIARSRLNRDGKDPDALFAVTLGAGLRADYLALVQRRGIAALRYTKEATNSAQTLLAVCPNCYDAYVATGISRYLIGTVSAPARWVLRLGGFEGDKQRGKTDLALAAERGHYLAPFARMLLAIVYVREKDMAHARETLLRLRDEFPANPLFPREIARLDPEQ